MLLTKTEPPEDHPLTLAEVKLHLRVDSPEEDAHINALLAAAVQFVETDLGRQLISAQYTLAIGRWPPDGMMELPRPPLQTVDSVTYLDKEGVEQTLDGANYKVYAQANPGYIKFRTTPAIAVQDDAIIITFTAGYGSAAADVPEPLKVAILMLVGHWFMNREAVTAVAATELPLGAARLIDMYRDKVFLSGGIR